MCPCHNSNFRGRNQRGFLAVQPLSSYRKPTFIYIDRDDTADSVYVKLQRDLNATHLTGFKMLARLKKYDQQIHSGAYRFDASINTLTLFRRLSSGHQTPVKVVIPSVRTLSRLARSLDRQLMPDSTEFARLVSDSAFCASLGFSLETMPALFIPNTYEAYWNTDAETFIQRMKKNMNVSGRRSVKIRPKPAD